MAIIHHITEHSRWAAALQAGSYRGDSLAIEGFIHCSTHEQMAETLRRHFAGRTGLVVLSIDEERVSAPIRYENLEGGTALFPHIYGPLEVGAVVEVREPTS